MRVIITARHMNLTTPLREHAEEKLGRSLMRVFDKPAAKIEIELVDLGEMKDNQSKECRVSVFMPRGRSINITEIDDDMYKAIDLARDRLIEQVKRERGRQRHASRNRKDAARERLETAIHSLTAEPEDWEAELREYEQSTSVA